MNAPVLRAAQVPVPEVRPALATRLASTLLLPPDAGVHPPTLLAVVTWGRAPERSPASIGTGRNACLPLLLLTFRANVTIRAVPRIYLDHNATTPLVPAALDKMTAAARDTWGNASSVHHFGQQAKAVLDEARASVAALLGAEPPEVVFTAGGTEGDNAAIRGAVEAMEPGGRRHLVVSAIEHEAVLQTAKSLARRGFAVSRAAGGRPAAWPTRGRWRHW